MAADIEGMFFRRHKKDCTLLIETGSYCGDGIRAALNADFENIISIEISKHQYDECVGIFEHDDNVSLILGDSREKLHDILCDKIIKDRSVFFWLDAHNSGGFTGGDGVEETAYKELEIIINYVQKNGIKARIVLDDMNYKTKEEVEEIIKTYPIKFVGEEKSFDCIILVYEMGYGK